MGHRYAIEDPRRNWSAQALDDAIHSAAATLASADTRRLATLVDNSAAFAVLDEAAAASGLVHVPLPLFFTPAQLRHALAAAGVDTLIAAPAAAAMLGELEWTAARLSGEALVIARLPVATEAPLPPLPPATQKITFTSGSTGSPKGVCLSLPAMRRVARGLVQATEALGIERHLSALPYAVLLENIAGWMAPRLAGATVLVQPLATLGVHGAASFDAARFDAVLRERRAHSVILLPQMLRAWCAHLRATRQRASAELRLVAVGGAAVGAPLVQAALELGIPVGEGWGLSEAASVQTLNLPGATKPGSAGRLLPHAELRVAADGELLVGGSLFEGYLGDTPGAPHRWWPSGDLGHVDAEGFVHIHGRKKNLLITGYGRNVSPEWVETALRSQPTIAEAVVLGDGQATLAAVLWPAAHAGDPHMLHAAVAATNATLPDYARIGRWTRAAERFDATSGMATGNGRPRREAIAAAHAEWLSATGAPMPLAEPARSLSTTDPR